MNYKKLKLLEDKISSGKIQKSSTLFGGANLIILDPERKNDYKNHRKRYPQDILVFTEHSQELSWLVFQLKAVFADEINEMNKYVFYPLMGEIMNNGIKKGYTLNVIMFNVILGCLKLKTSEIL